MSIPDFEPDQDFVRAGAIALGNDETGQFIANPVEADEFDPGISRDVEGLLLLGYLTQNVKIFGHEFVLKTLTRGEKLAVSLFVRDYEDTIGIGLALETATLALSIISCDGRVLSVPLSDREGPAEMLERNWPVVSQWYDPVLVTLYVSYQELNARMEAAFLELQGKSTAGRATSSL